MLKTFRPFDSYRLPHPSRIWALETSAPKWTWWDSQVSKSTTFKMFWEMMEHILFTIYQYLPYVQACQKPVTMVEIQLFRGIGLWMPYPSVSLDHEAQTAADMRTNNLFIFNEKKPINLHYPLWTAGANIYDISINIEMNGGPDRCNMGVSGHGFFQRRMALIPWVLCRWAKHWTWHPQVAIYGKSEPDGHLHFCG